MTLQFYQFSWPTVIIRTYSLACNYKPIQKSSSSAGAAEGKDETGAAAANGGSVERTDAEADGAAAIGGSRRGRGFGKQRTRSPGPRQFCLCILVCT